MERFNVSRASIRQALSSLDNDGLEHPAGVQFGGLVGYLTDRGLDPESTVRDLRRAVPPAEVQEALRLGPGALRDFFTEPCNL